MALAFGHHAGQQAHGDAQRTKVVQLHGAFKVMEAVITCLNGAANGTARVIDQEINAAVFGFQHLGELGATHSVGNINRIREDFGVLTGKAQNLFFGLGQLVFAPPADDGDGTGFSKLAGRRQANAGRASGDQHHFAADRAFERAVNVQVRVKMALPIIPQTPSVVFEVRAFNA